jgi:hypothetical protein
MAEHPHPPDKQFADNPAAKLAVKNHNYTDAPEAQKLVIAPCHILPKYSGTIRHFVPSQDRADVDSARQTPPLANDSLCWKVSSELETSERRQRPALSF